MHVPCEMPHSSCQTACHATRYPVLRHDTVCWSCYRYYIYLSGSACDLWSPLPLQSLCLTYPLLTQINRRSTRCQITHIPTGIVVSSQKTRSLVENRKIARQILADKLDQMYAAPGTSRKEVVGAFKKSKVDRAQKKKDRKYKQLGEGAEEEAEMANQRAKEAYEELMRKLGK